MRASASRTKVISGFAALAAAASIVQAGEMDVPGMGGDMMARAAQAYAPPSGNVHNQKRAQMSLIKNYQGESEVSLLADFDANAPLRPELL